MTYEQILKDSRSFGEGSVRFIATRTDFESFLKQSFIKYLQGEVDACQQYKSYYNSIGDEYNTGKHKAMDDMIERLQAQIKELQ